MNVSCDSEIAVLNENALRFSIFTRPAPVIEYIRTISSLVGASHVLAVFEESDSIKVFFDDKKYVDSLIRTSVHVLGRHVRSDYVVPPGTKVVLSNIDPVITNFDVLSNLAFYGTVVSPVIRPPICDDVELCHIGYGVRYVYMKLTSNLPDKLEFKYGDQTCQVKTRIGEEAALLPMIVKYDYDAESGSTSSSLTDYNSFAHSEIPVLVNVQSTAEEATSNEQHDKTEPVNPVTRRGRWGAKALHMKRRKLTATSRAAKRIKRNVKHKWGARKYKTLRRGGKRQGGKSAVISTPGSLLESPITPGLQVTSPSVLDNSTSLFLPDDNQTDVFTPEILKSFLAEVKHHRAPFDLVRKYLGENCNATGVKNLIGQLMRSKYNCNKISLKLRLSRLIKTLEDALQDLE